MVSILLFIAIISGTIFRPAKSVIMTTLHCNRLIDLHQTLHTASVDPPEKKLLKELIV